MSDRYRDAVLCIARWTAERVARAYPDRPQIFVANATAGTRYRHRLVRRTAAERCDGRGPTPQVWWTESGDEARRRVGERLAAPDLAEPVVVSLGGDGTHNHILHAGLDHAGRGLYLRLPLGSGNDATESSSLADALDELNGVMTPRWLPAVRVRSALREYVAFNIASVGIDAYVTALHDRWRTALPGNTYRLLVDLAVLGYDRLVDNRPMDLELTDFDGRSYAVASERRTLVAMGVSGDRTYGDHMRVLPGPENLCVIAGTSVGDKVRLKRQFYEGRHADLPITSLYRCRSLLVRYPGRIPLQCDGEAVWLSAEEFPLRMQIEDRAVRVLASDRLA